MEPSPIATPRWNLSSWIREQWFLLQCHIVAWILSRQDSNLVQHAERELRMAGMFDPDSDYGGVLGREVLNIIRLFSMQGHSGGSAQLTNALVHRLVDYGTLTHNDHSMHNDVSEVCGKPHGTVLQDSRDSRWFSNDGGVTWHNVEEAHFPGLPSSV